LEIEILLNKKYSIREIARVLKRSVSTISEEIKRNKVNRIYEADKAQHKSYVRRKDSKYQGMKIVKNRELREFVEGKLLRDTSPRNLSGRIRKREKWLPSISKNSIYRYIKSPYGRKVEYEREKRKYKIRYRQSKNEKLTERVFINKRSKVVNDRKRIGDMEADFIVSGKAGKGRLLVVVDRKSRYPLIEKIYPVTITNIEKGFLKIKNRFRELKTITIDNDILLKDHKRLEEILNAKIYFCNPYHSWEKGTVERINREIRKDIPKGANISKYSKQYLKKTETKLQNKIYEILGYKTPQEIINKYYKKKNPKH
jgi:IS30 family transposase